MIARIAATRAIVRICLAAVVAACLYDCGRKHTAVRVDRTFGVDGVATIHVTQFDDPQGEAALTDGRLAIMNVSSVGLLVEVVTTMGVLDTTFGAGGVKSAFPGLGYGRLLPGADGGVFLVGYDSNRDRIASFRADGTRNADFGSAGVLTIAGNPPIAVDGKGRILVASGTSVLRLTSNGALDGGFGTNGGADVGLPVDAVLADTVDRVLLQCSAGTPVLIRLSTGGAIDASYGDSGLAAVPTYTEEGGLDSLGRVLLFGNHGALRIMSRFTPTGEIDPSFESPPETGHAVYSMGVAPNGASFFADDSADGLGVAYVPVDGGEFDYRFARLDNEAHSRGMAVDARGRALLLGQMFVGTSEKDAVVVRFVADP